jgi:RimJ/RimL family protein N-acetyltransferase
MVESDLETVARWLAEPHVNFWFAAGSSIDEEVEELRASIRGVEPTTALLVYLDDAPIGWCQWYLCSDYPEHEAGVSAEPGDVGIDYAIGEPNLVARGTGTELIAALVAEIHSHHPHAGIIADPEAANQPSRRVLEKNGFTLVDERLIESEPTDDLMAIYRLPGA